MKRSRRAWIWVALAILLVGIIGAATDESSDDAPAGAAAAAPSPSRTASYATARRLAIQSRRLRATAATRSVLARARAGIARQEAAARERLNPDSPDYDCAGGSGDGPDYTGPVRSVGSDPFDLDRDGDGLACETS